MINLKVQTSALFALLEAAAAAAPASKITVKRGERINYDPAVCPWIGVYPGAVDSVPHTIGSGTSRWANKAEVQVVLQTASLTDDGQAASDELEALIASVLSVVNSNLTLGITGTRVLSVSREYRYMVFDDDGMGSVFMPQCVIKLDMEVRSA